MYAEVTSKWHLRKISKINRPYRYRIETDIIGTISKNLVLIMYNRITEKLVSSNFIKLPTETKPLTPLTPSN